MKVKIVILISLILAILTISLAGCAKCISVEYEQVEVTVVDKFHRAMWVQPVRTGKSITFITHPAIWDITVEYKGVEYSIGGSDTYKKYEDKIGQNAIGELEIRNYDDGTVKYDIVSLQ